MKKIEAVIFDWAGTTVDYGCFAPVQAFMEVFKSFGIEPTMAETRKPMGMLKRDHIHTMMDMPRINRLWQEKYGRGYTEEDIDALYAQFEEKLMSILDRSSPLLRCLRWGPQTPCLPTPSAMSGCSIRYTGR